MDHKSFKVPKVLYYSYSSRYARIFAFALTLLLSSIVARVMYNPKVVHGADLDGFALGKLAFPVGVKRILEVYDPWTTMTNSSLAMKLESHCLEISDAVILPSNDCPLNVKQGKAVVLRNAVDWEVARAALAKADCAINIPVKFILVGGTVGNAVGISELIEYTGGRSDISVVIASDFTLAEFDIIPENVQIIGKVAWGTWLDLVSRSTVVWAWYDRDVRHYAEHISPNKYWEAVLFGTPLLVNSLSQFCDRVPSEPAIFEVGDFRDDSAALEDSLIQLELLRGANPEKRTIRQEVSEPMAEARQTAMARVAAHVKL